MEGLLLISPHGGLQLVPFPLSLATGKKRFEYCSLWEKRCSYDPAIPSLFRTVAKGIAIRSPMTNVAKMTARIQPYWATLPAIRFGRNTARNHMIL